MHDLIVGLGGTSVKGLDKEQLWPMAVGVFLFDAQILLLESAPRCFL